MSGFVRFSVRGTPEPQGSVKIVGIPVYGVPGAVRYPKATTDNPSLREWRDLVRRVAQDRLPDGFSLFDGPVCVVLRLRLQRPASAPKKRRTWPKGRPDLDKLVRGCLDALTGIVWADDARVVEIHATKDYGEPGLDVEAWAVDGPSGPARRGEASRG